jgi:hypothetical protein
MSGEVIEVGTWKRHPEWNRHFLVVDRDGGILLASSSSKKQRHALARFDVSGPVPKLDGIREKKRELVIAPVVDESGYTLLLRKNQKQLRIKVVRKAALALKPAKLSKVGHQL